MGVVGGAYGQTPTLFEQPVQVPEPVRAIAFDSAAVVVDLHRMGGVDPPRVIQRQTRPFRMRDGDEGARLPRAAGDFGAGLLPFDGHEIGTMRRREIFRQANGEDVPQLAIVHRAGMQLRAENGGEPVVAEGPGVDDGIVVKSDEMVRQRDEVVPFRLVAAAHFLRLQHAVGAGGMGVQVAAPEFAGGGEGFGAHEVGS